MTAAPTPSWATEDLRRALVGLDPEFETRARILPNNAIAKPFIALFDAIKAAPGLVQPQPQPPHAPVPDALWMGADAFPGEAA